MSGSHETGAPSLLADRYVVERCIGRGGMGAVYLALDLKHDRHVAVKLLGDGPHQPDATRRFLAELRTAAGLSHPHILPVHDGGDADGTLYYVMPHVEGRSLRERLERDARLTIAEAARIACQIAGALAYAHARGVVHRDVKPENILLDRDGHAYLADFGLARAVSSVEATRLTQGGVVLGSPHYMSPEQVAGASAVDGRSDIYSLGCVLYEMLIGATPFPGGDAHSILRRHLHEPAPSLRSRRADVGPVMEHVIATALAKSADDRFASADAMVAELAPLAANGSQKEAPPNTPPAPPPLMLRRIGGGIAAIILLAIVIFVYYGGTNGMSVARASAMDSTLYAILPLSGAARDGGVTDLLYDAFRRWRDIDIVDRVRVADAVQRRDPEGDGLSPAEALQVATELGAGRYVHGMLATVGDSLRVDASLYDAVVSGARLRTASVRLPFGGESPMSHFLTLADSLLFGRVTLGEAPVTDTNSRQARALFGDAWLALERWDLPAAESLFAGAYEQDADFDRALLWVAQLRNWSGAPSTDWAPEALRIKTVGLPPRERLLAGGLAELARGDPTDACESYRSILGMDERDFAGLFGIGECLSRDLLVIPDPSTSSGWRFRSSYHRAARAYQEAFEVIPASHVAFQAAAFDRIRKILFTRPNLIRVGVDSLGRQYPALPEWDGDSLLFMPRPWTRGQPAPAPEPARLRRALLEQRRAFQSITGEWVRAYPNSPYALHALSLSLGMLADGAALPTIRRARLAAVSDAQRRELAILDVWMRLRFAVPDDIRQLRAARLLADSLLATGTAETAAEEAALAVLLGRPHAAAAMGRIAAQENPDSGLHPSVTSRAAALLAYAAVGAPVDSIESLFRQADMAISRSVGPETLTGVRAALLELPAILAFDMHALPIFDKPSLLQSDVGRAQAALKRGAQAEARRHLATLRAARAGSLPGEVTLDMLFAEASVMAALGDTAAAIEWIEPTLLQLEWMPQGTLETPAAAGALVRSAALRASLARRQGDMENVQRWMRVVRELWSDGEQRIRQLAGAGPPSRPAVRRSVQLTGGGRR